MSVNSDLPIDSLDNAYNDSSDKKGTGDFVRKHLSAQPNFNQAKTSDQVLLIESDQSGENKESMVEPMLKKRAKSGDVNTFVEVAPFLEKTGWFDTNEEFDQHKRKFKNKLNLSVREDGEYEDYNKYRVYQSYKNKGGT